MESLTWIAVVMAAINTIDSIVTKVLNATQKMKEDANKTALALKTAELSATAAEVKTKMNQTASEIATVKMVAKENSDRDIECQKELAALKSSLESKDSSIQTLHNGINSRIASVEASVVSIAASLPPTQLPPIQLVK